MGALPTRIERKLIYSALQRVCWCLIFFLKFFLHTTSPSPQGPVKAIFFRSVQKVLKNWTTPPPGKKRKKRKKKKKTVSRLVQKRQLHFSLFWVPGCAPSPPPSPLRKTRSPGLKGGGSGGGESLWGESLTVNSRWREIRVFVWEGVRPIGRQWFGNYAEKVMDERGKQGC